MLKKLLFTLLAASALQAGAMGPLRIDLSDGSATITPETVTLGDGSTVSATRYTSFIITSSGETANGLTITGGTEASPVDIFFDNLNINRSNVNDGNHTLSCPVYIESGYVNLLLINESTVRGGVNNPGICVPDGAMLTIGDAYGDDSGILHAFGGSEVAGGGGGAGIGGEVYGTCGTLILNSGTVYAKGCKGGAGFGSGWQWEPSSTLAGGTFIQNGGEAHFTGSSAANYNSYLRGSCFEGVGSVNAATTVQLNGGTFYSTVRTNSTVTVKGETATAQTFSGMTPDATYTLYHQFGTPETSVTADSGGNFIYWLAGEQSVAELIGDRATIKVATNPAGYGTITGAGFYAIGECIELKYTPNYSVYDFDSWSNGSTDNPTTISVGQDMTVTANVSPKVSRMWSAYPISGSETECYISMFNGNLYAEQELEVPETFEIEGKTYITTALGNNSDMGMDMFEMRLPDGKLDKLTLPAALTAITPAAFSGFSSLNTLAVNAATPPALTNNATKFYDIPSDCTLKVPYGTSAAYAAAPGWKDFATIEELPNPVPTLDVASGSVSITPEGYTIDGVFTAFGGRYVLTSSAETTNGVTISGGTEDSPLDITIDNLNINRSAVNNGDRNVSCPVYIEKGYVDMTLAGESTLRGGVNNAGIELPDGAFLTIAGDGVLHALGGAEVAGGGGGAGIGGSVYGTCGTLTLNSGTVYAQGCKGGAGFGSGWEYTPNGSKAGGKFIQNGGEAHFRGAGPSIYAYRAGSCPEGVGSVNGATTVELNDGIFDSTIRTNTSVTVKGETAKSYTQSGMTPGATYTLQNMLLAEETSVTADSDGNFVYWLVGDQTFKELIGNRCIVSATVSTPYAGAVTGAGFYEVGEQVELKYVRASGSIYDFDDWSNGSTDNPTTITVSEDMTITANVSPKVDLMWRSRPVNGSETECYVDGFEGMEFTGTTLSLPESFEIDGKTYTTVSLGEPQDGMFHAMMHGEINELILPATLTQISSRTFSMMHLNNATVTVNAATPPALIGDATAFDYIPDGCTLKVPKGSAEAYKAAPGWKDFDTVDEMDTTGLGDVGAADNEAPVYYDLRGVIVGSDIRTLVPGLYIERRGTSVKRILVDR